MTNCFKIHLLEWIPHTYTFYTPHHHHFLEGLFYILFIDLFFPAGEKKDRREAHPASQRQEAPRTCLRCTVRFFSSREDISCNSLFHRECKPVGKHREKQRLPRRVEPCFFNLLKYLFIFSCAGLHSCTRAFSSGAPV